MAKTKKTAQPAIARETAKGDDLVRLLSALFVRKGVGRYYDAPVMTCRVASSSGACDKPAARVFALLGNTEDQYMSITSACDEHCDAVRLALDDVAEEAESL